MNKQMTFAYFCAELAQIKTNKKVFLKRMEKLTPWDEWLKIIKSYHYKGKCGNKPYDLERMLKATPHKDFFVSNSQAYCGFDCMIIQHDYSFICNYFVNIEPKLYPLSMLKFYNLFLCGVALEFTFCKTSTIYPTWA